MTINVSKASLGVVIAPTKLVVTKASMGVTGTITETGRVAQVSVEALHSGEGAPTQVSQIAVEVLRSVTVGARLNRPRSTVSFILNDISSSGSQGIAYPTTARAVFDASSLGLSLSDGSSVSSWSSSGGNYTITGGTVKPVYLTNIVNGYPIVRSVSTTDSMPIPSNLISDLTGASGGTIIYVGKVNSITHGGLFCDFGTHVWPNHYPYTDNNVYEDFLSDSRPSYGSAATTAMQSFHVGALRSKTNLRDWRVAEIQRYNSTTNNFSVNTAPLLFRSAYAGEPGWSGDLAFWAFFNSYLSDTDVLSWEAFLKSRYGL